MSTAKEMFKQFLNENPTRRTFTFIVETYERDSRGATVRKNITAPTLFAALVKAFKFRSIGNCLDYYGFPVDMIGIDIDEGDFTIEEFEESLNASDEEIASALNEVNGDGGDYIIIMEGKMQWVGDVNMEYYEEDDNEDEEY